MRGIITLAFVMLVAILIPVSASEKLVVENRNVTVVFYNYDECLTKNNLKIIRYYWNERNNVSIDVIGVNPDHVYTYYLKEVYSGDIVTVKSFTDVTEYRIELPIKDLYAGEFDLIIEDSTLNRDIFVLSDLNYRMQLHTSLPQIHIEVLNPTRDTNETSTAVISAATSTNVSTNTIPSKASTNNTSINASINQTQVEATLTKTPIKSKEGAQPLNQAKIAKPEIVSNKTKETIKAKVQPGFELMFTAISILVVIYLIRH